MDKETILVVDDESEIRDLIEILLENEGYRIIKAANGKEALDVLDKHNIDLIILDIMMPEMDGIETCINVRKEKNMPIIMLSAKSRSAMKPSTSGAVPANSTRSVTASRRKTYLPPPRLPGQLRGILEDSCSHTMHRHDDA
jgi:CheY-like chemotaxis protein